QRGQEQVLSAARVMHVPPRPRAREPAERAGRSMGRGRERRDVHHLVTLRETVLCEYLPAARHDECNARARFPHERLDRRAQRLDHPRQLGNSHRSDSAALCVSSRTRPSWASRSATAITSISPPPATTTCPAVASSCSVCTPL